MEYTYEVIKLESGFETIKRIGEDGLISFIPMDETNSDYQEYLKQLEEGSN